MFGDKVSDKSLYSHHVNIIAEIHNQDFGIYLANKLKIELQRIITPIKWKRLVEEIMDYHSKSEDKLIGSVLNIQHPHISGSDQINKRGELKHLCHPSRKK